MIKGLDGFGLGLRKPHYADFLQGSVTLDFVEVISENFMVEGGRPLDILRRVRSNYPVALHGVSMSLGSADGVRRDYLVELKRLADAIEPIFVSDHLSWSSIGGLNSHDLLPLPFTEEALKIFCANVVQAQDMLGRTLLIENPSAYVSFASSTMKESDFLTELCRRTGCGLLLDVNNVFVTCSNQGLDPFAYLDQLPMEAVRQIHLAGHSKGRDLLIDTHDHPVCDDVWALYSHAVSKLSCVAVMIERDDHIPLLADLLEEMETARRIRASHQRQAA